MKHLLLKTWLILVCLVLGSASAWADEATFTFSDVAEALLWENGVGYTNVTLGNFSFTVSGGGNNGKYYTSDSTWRFYDGGGLTITPEKEGVSKVSIQTLAHPLFVREEKNKQSPDFPKPGLCHAKDLLYLCT